MRPIYCISGKGAHIRIQAFLKCFYADVEEWVYLGEAFCKQGIIEIFSK